MTNMKQYVRIIKIPAMAQILGNIMQLTQLTVFTFTKEFSQVFPNYEMIKTEHRYLQEN